MTAAPTADNIAATIQGKNQGQIAVGKHIMQVHAEAGAIVNVAKQGGLEPSPCALPVISLPSRGPTLVGRRDIVHKAKSALTEWTHFQLYGESEIGKTTILKHFCYLFEQDQSIFTDGIVYIRRRKSHEIDDLLQLIFDSFYQPCDPQFRPNISQFKTFMKEIRALVVVDDAELERDEIQDLLDAAPKSAFLLASCGRNLWSGGEAVEVEGLPPDDAVVVLESGLQRTLEAAERVAALEFCQLLAGRPLRLLQEADELRKRDQSLIEVVASLRPAPPTNSPDSPTTEATDPPASAANVPVARAPSADSPLAASSPHAAAAMTAAEKQIATVAASLNGELISEQHLLAAAKLLSAAAAAAPSATEEGEAFAHLRAAGQIFSGSGFCLAGEVQEAIKRDDPQAIDNCRAHLLDYFTTWCEEHRDESEQVLADVEPILEILNWAVETERWREAMNLGLLIEQTLFLSKRWGPWKVVLDTLLRAARGLGDRRREAWALHQLGTLRFARRDARDHEAAKLLKQAQDIREEIGDPFGVAISQHNWRLARPWILRTIIRLAVLLVGMIIASLITYSLMSHGHVHYQIETLPELPAGTSRTSRITLEEAAPEKLTIQITSDSPDLLAVALLAEGPVDPGLSTPSSSVLVTIDQGSKQSSAFTYTAVRSTSTETELCKLKVEPTNLSSRLVMPGKLLRINVAPYVIPDLPRVKSISFHDPLLLNGLPNASGTTGGNKVVCKIEFDGPVRNIEPHETILTLRSQQLGTVPPDIAVKGNVLDPIDDHVARFEINTMPVSERVDVTVTVKNDTTNGQFPIWPPAPRTITLPEVVLSGQEVMAEVQLDGDAPPGGAIVRLSAKRLAPANASLLPDGTIPVALRQPSAATSFELSISPSELLIAAGQRSASFSIHCPVIEEDVQFALQAESKGKFFRTVVDVKAAGLRSLVLSPESVDNSGKVTATVRLLETAPANGTRIALHYVADKALDRALVDAPASVTVPSGKNQASVQFELAQSDLRDTGQIQVVATYPRSSVLHPELSATFAIAPLPARLLDFTLDTKLLQGGRTLTGEIVLERPAPADGAQIRLTAKRVGENGEMSSAVLVNGKEGAFAANQSRKKLQLPLGHVTKALDIVVAATDEHGTTIERTVRVEPEGLAAFTLESTIVDSGKSIVGTVRLNAPAARNVQIELTYDFSPRPRPGDPSVLVNPPTSIDVDAETANVAFAWRTNPDLQRNTTVTVTARLHDTSLTRIASVEVAGKHAQLVHFTLEQPKIPCGGRTRGRVTLNRPAEAAGLTVKLTSSDNRQVRIPSQVIFAKGQQTATFAIATLPSKLPVRVDIVASQGEQRQQATLRVAACQEKIDSPHSPVPPTPPGQPNCRRGIFRFLHR